MSQASITVDGYAPDFRSSTLHYGIIKGNSEIVRECIRQGDRLDLQCEDTGMTYLHLVMANATPMTESSFVPIVYLFSNANTNLGVRDRKGETPLQLSIKFHLLGLMEALLKCGVSPDPSDEGLIMRHAAYFQDEFLGRFRKFHPGYWDAVGDNKRFRVNILVKSWCRINISRNGLSLIEYAKQIGADDGIVDLLMKHEASIEFAHAVIAGDEDRIKLLLHYGSVDLQTQDWTNQENYSAPYVPLGLKDAAIKYGHKHILYILDKNIEAINQKPMQNSAFTTSTVCAIM